MKPLLLSSLVFLSLFTACQSALPTKEGRTVVIQLPASGSRDGAPAEKALTAYPAGILNSINHYLVKITDGTNSLVSDQTVAVDAVSVTFTGVPVGNHWLIVEAWTESAQTAVAVTPLTVDDDTATTVGPPVLGPVTGTGPGDFDLVVTVGTRVQALFLAGQLTARLSPLAYSGDSLDSTGSALASDTVTLSLPQANSLRLQATALPSGNYQLELLGPDTALPTPGLFTIAVVLVQVYTGQTAELPVNTSLSDSFAETSLIPPQSLRVDLAADGTRTFSWEAPKTGFLTQYQVGWAPGQPDEPAFGLTLTGGIDGNFLVPGTSLDFVGDRYHVSLDLTKAPWSPTQTARLFVRTLNGPSVGSVWSFLDVDTASMASDLEVFHLAFTGLRSGTTYELQRLAANDSVLEARSFTTGVTTEGVTFDFPGLVLHQGEKLQLAEHGANGLVEFPVSTALLPTPTPGLYSSSTVFRAYFGFTSDKPNFTQYFLSTNQVAAPPAFTAAETNIGWDKTNGGKAWPQLFGVNPSLSSVESNHYSTPSSAWEPTFPGTGTAAYPEDWKPTEHEITRYRLRVGYSLDRDSDSVPDLTLYGPASGWKDVDRQAPVISTTLTNGVSFNVTSTNDIMLTVTANEALGSTSVSIVNSLGSVAISNVNVPVLVSTPDVRQYQWRTDWTNGSVGQKDTWALVPVGTYYLAVVVSDTSSNSKTYYVPITLVGGPNK